VCRAADVSDEDAWPCDTTESAMATHNNTSLGERKHLIVSGLTEMNEAQGVLGERGFGQLLAML